MGEIAEMMIEGVLCNCCGEYLGEDAGYPRLCAGCTGETVVTKRVKKAGKRAVCEHCGKTFIHTNALGQHLAQMRRNGTHK